MKKKTLYVSDLDGTLLHSEGRLTSTTETIINRLINDGAMFSVATARNFTAATRLIQSLNLSTPGIYNNGVAFYNYQKQDYIKLNDFPRDRIPALLDIFNKFQISGFLYALKNNKIHMLYQQPTKQISKDYLETRYNLYYPNCLEVKNFNEIPPEFTLLYFILNEAIETATPVCEKIKALSKINCILSEDIYGGNYFVDILNQNASKGIAVKQLKELTGADEIVAFGDNYNDLEMLKAADRAYVPENGVPEAKALATAIIDANDKDGVARFIEKDFWN